MVLKTFAKWFKKDLAVPTDNRGGWFSVFEPFTGAFQQDVKIDRDQVLAYHAIFACVTLIASDISKLRPKLVRLNRGVWEEIAKKNYAVLDKPNTSQNRIQFFENWLLSKLSRGNTYVLKERDQAGRVVGFHVLAPDLVTTLISDEGEVFYRLGNDNVSGITEQITVPASEIIHDRFNCLFHPLVGISPIFASGLSAVHGLNIQKNGALFFGNMSRPSGIITAPGHIDKDVAGRVKTAWETNFGGKNIGRVAVLGDDMKFISVAATAEQSQMIEQLRLSAEIVCSTYHVPKHKVIGDPPSYNNIEALEQQYYSQCLQSLIEAIELCLDEGLGLGEDIGVELDLDGLLRMDTATRIDALGKAVTGGLMTPNEARLKLNLTPVVGGDTPYLQQQNFSLEALAKRDAQDDPFGKSQPAPTEPMDTTKVLLHYRKGAAK